MTDDEQLAAVAAHLTAVVQKATSETGVKYVLGVAVPRASGGTAHQVLVASNLESMQEAQELVDHMGAELRKVVLA